VFTLRYLDVCLVLATAPVVIAGGLPLTGYLIAAAAWILTRLAAAFLQAQARRAGDMKIKAGLQLAGMMGRVWIVALAVILARVAGGKDDGIMAAALMLAAFTVYFAMSFVTRDGPTRAGPSAAASATPGRPSTS
jgi:hypothetical protein